MDVARVVYTLSFPVDIKRQNSFLLTMTFTNFFSKLCEFFGFGNPDAFDVPPDITITEQTNARRVLRERREKLQEELLLLKNPVILFTIPPKVSEFNVG